jgi:sigma-B regulation protein RsbU (phosphoserine phosphatase)
MLTLLLGISLAPTGVAVWWGQDASRALADDLARGIREWLALDAERFLLQTVRDNGRMLEGELQAAELNLHLQACLVERCLARQGTRTAPEVIPAHRFEAGEAIPGLAPSERHLRIGADGRLEPVHVSYERQCYVIAPDADPGRADADLARLAPLLACCQELHTSQPDLVQWRYTALESGVLVSFPGHGHYPAGYDARRRPWYRAAAGAGKPTWNPLLVDASTSRILLTVSMPVYDPDGAFAGVTALDLLVGDFARRVDLPPLWADAAEIMAVVPDADGSTGELRMLRIAERGFQTSPDWDAPLAPEFVTSADTVQFELMREDLLASRAAVRRMPFEDQPALWAYGPLGDQGAALLVIVPYELVVAPALEAERSIRARFAAQRVLVASLLLGVVMTVVLLSALATRQFTRPIRELAAAAQRVAAGDFGTPVAVRTRDELGELGATVNAMLPQLRDRIRIKQSLAVAMEVQQHFLPQRSPEIPGLEVAGRSLYCDETGGDYYDYLELSTADGHTLGVAVGDVTGHGIGAALLMASARALLRSRAWVPENLGTILTHMNRELAADVTEGRFMTLCYLLLEGRQRTVRWANAGHDPAILYRAADDSFTELGGAGIPLGVDAKWAYQEFGPQSLEAHDIVVLGTDGIWEARNAAEEMFGKERLREVVRAEREEPAEKILDAVTAAIAQFQAGRAADDDITLVVVKVQPQG